MIGSHAPTASNNVQQPMSNAMPDAAATPKVDKLSRLFLLGAALLIVPIALNYGLFPAKSDPETAPITMLELKGLVRIWKLHNEPVTHQVGAQRVEPLLSGEFGEPLERRQGAVRPMADDCWCVIRPVHRSGHGFE
ncbi:MAG: hypothetical protein AAF354_01590, partial [Pseudomonadota bacterium]